MICPACLSLMLLALPAAEQGEDLYARQVAELKVIKRRMVEARVLSDAHRSPAVESARTRLDRDVDEILLAEGGYWTAWEDVSNPAISFNGAAWNTPLALARAYASPGSRHHHSEPVLRAVDSGLRHLLGFAYPDCPQAGNWWSWQIGIPMHLLDTLMILERDLDPGLLEQEVATLAWLMKVREDLKLSGPHVVRPPVAGKCDTNALWHKRLRMQLGVLIENPAMAGKWAAESADEIGPPGAGHLQEDFSFKFHGPIPMWAYGTAFMMDYGNLAVRTSGTSFAPRPEQVDLYAEMARRYVEGFLWRGRVCPAIAGRELIRGEEVYRVSFGAAGIYAMASLVQLGHRDAPLFARLIARERAFFTDRPETATRIALATADVPHAEPAPPAIDIFAYPDSDFLQVTRPGWAVGIKMHSQRNRGYEAINEENMQGWFLSHGSMFHFVDGDEWNGCWPTLDWTRLPGTTVASEVRGQSASPFAGVVRGSAQVALAGVHLASGDYTARKSWLVDGDAIVCFGSAIAGPDPTVAAGLRTGRTGEQDDVTASTVAAGLRTGRSAPRGGRTGRVETTLINQPGSPETPLVIDGTVLAGAEIDRRTRADWLWHQGVGYVFFTPTEVQVLRESRTSDWSSVRGPRLHGKTPPVTHHYTTVTIPHTQAASEYAYIFLPNVQRERMPDLARQVRARYTLVSTGTHHVRTSDGRVESIVFWQPGTSDRITASAPCLLLRTEGRRQVVDPTWSGVELQLDIDGHKANVKPVRGRPVTLE